MQDSVTEDHAVAIYQAMLDDIRRSYAERDFSIYNHHLHVPQVCSTFGGTEQIDTPEQLQETFNCVCDYLTSLGVTEFKRTCTSAVVFGPNKIIGSHITELIGQGGPLREPYEVWVTLEYLDGRWKVTSSENAVSGTSWQAYAFRQGAQLKMAR
ncbi:MAG: hypothetical protein NWQ23_08240 [Yoonia sp.]|uniref:hypothetical protein n=1 Tax=Yoonia sp. TaxID=2212373 RepID=UPI00273E7CB4|nr:hypothetical protein [Yoonia sp.]MDP5085396.1 hypothetical protein [Yoonia sp.]MDP5362727.1 hypothetical protein [Paracoccaceae bacterium]